MCLCRPHLKHGATARRIAFRSKQNKDVMQREKNRWNCGFIAPSNQCTCMHMPMHPSEQGIRPIPSHSIRSCPIPSHPNAFIPNSIHPVSFHPTSLLSIAHHAYTTQTALPRTRLITTLLSPSSSPSPPPSNSHPTPSSRLNSSHPRPVCSSNILNGTAMYARPNALSVCRRTSSSANAISRAHAPSAVDCRRRKRIQLSVARARRVRVSLFRVGVLLEDGERERWRLWAWKRA